MKWPPKDLGARFPQSEERGHESWGRSDSETLNGGGGRHLGEQGVGGLISAQLESRMGGTEELPLQRKCSQSRQQRGRKYKP